MNLSEHEKTLTRLKARLQLLQEEVKDINETLRALRKGYEEETEARDVMSAVLAATQERLTAYIEEVASLALSSVFGEQYGFRLNRDVKRNRDEAEPIIIKDGLEYSVRDEVGGGVLDVLSVALRLALWSVTNPQPSPVLLLDEPGKFVSRDKQAAFGRMLKDVAAKLGVQIIMVSHSTRIIEAADQAYEVEQVNGVSCIKEMTS